MNAGRCSRLQTCYSLTELLEWGPSVGHAGIASVIPGPPKTANAPHMGTNGTTSFQSDRLVRRPLLDNTTFPATR